MPKICIEIELDTDTGSYAVGKCEPKEEAAGGEGASDMAGEQQFDNVDDALAAAKDLLSGGASSENTDVRNQVAGEVWPQAKKPAMPMPQGMA